MFSLNDYAHAYHRDPDHNFAVACFDQHSLDELEEAAARDADPTDMATWDLASTQEWHDAIAAALWERMSPRVETVNRLIASMGLADEYGERGGLLAEYIVAQGLIIRDEAYTEHFPSDVDVDTIRTYLQGFVEDRHP